MLALRNISIELAGRHLVHELTLAVQPGEVVTIMGPSGVGKSALLSYVGGDLDPAFTAHGDVTLNGKSMTAVKPEHRRIVRLFQDDLLFPHMTVGENLLFAIPDLPRIERLALMRTALQNAELQGYEQRAPHTLSGGQRARVSLMRALLAKPDAILLDEPFSKLDADLRQTIRNHTYAQITARAIPALLVTHDPDDVPPGGRVVHLLPDGHIRHA
jgi:putative thiamine transport system ATP-binding protein